MANPLQAEKVWTQKNLYDQAESNYVMHLSKLLNGFENQPVKTKIKQEHQIEKKGTSKSKEAITSQCAVAAPLPSETKKEKEKKNKRINKSKEAARTASVDSNLEAQPYAKPKPAVITQPKLSTESEQSEKEEPALNIQPLKKPKKDRWRDRKNKNAKNKEEEVSSNTCTVTQPLTASVKGKEPAPQDEKKVGSGASQGTLVSEIAKARQHIKNSLERMDGIAALAAASPGGDVLQRLATLEVENRNLVELTNLLKKTLSETQSRIQILEDRLSGLSISSAPSKQPQNGKSAPKKEEADDDDGVDLFGSDSEEDEEVAKVREKRLAEYAAKKSKKPALIAKSSLVLDIKPWDDETDLKVMEGEVRKIICDGLLWGASKFVPVAFGIKKLTISCVVEDEKVSIDWLTEQIELIEEYVQSVDVAAFNKI